MTQHWPMTCDRESTKGLASFPCFQKDTESKDFFTHLEVLQPACDHSWHFPQYTLLCGSLYLRGTALSINSLSSHDSPTGRYWNYSYLLMRTVRSCGSTCPRLSLHKVAKLEIKLRGHSLSQEMQWHALHKRCS